MFLVISYVKKTGNKLSKACTTKTVGNFTKECYSFVSNYIPDWAICSYFARK
jgi:hypothetical protein